MFMSQIIHKLSNNNKIIEMQPEWTYMSLLVRINLKCMYPLQLKTGEWYIDFTIYHIKSHTPFL